MRIPPALITLAMRSTDWQRSVLSRHGEDPERGDVPGWVFVTMMSAALATALYLIAGPALQAMLTDALSAVMNP